MQKPTSGLLQWVRWVSVAPSRRCCTSETGHYLISSSLHRPSLSDAFLEGLSVRLGRPASRVFGAKVLGQRTCQNHTCRVHRGPTSWRTDRAPTASVITWSMVTWSHRGTIAQPVWWRRLAAIFCTPLRRRSAWFVSISGITRDCFRAIIFAVGPSCPT